MTLRPILLAALLAPAPALAQPASPGDDPAIAEGLIDVAIAYELGRACGPVDARRLQGIGVLLGLQARARSLGFSQDEVDAYVDDEAERARLESVARDRLAGLGATPGDEASHCAVARAEIDKGTPVGRLLGE